METLREKIFRVNRELIELEYELKSMNDSRRILSNTNDEYIDWVNKECFTYKGTKENVVGADMMKLLQSYIIGLEMIQEESPVKVVFFNVFSWTPYTTFLSGGAAEVKELEGSMVKCPDCGVWVDTNCPDCICGHHFFDIDKDSVRVEYDRVYGSDYVSKFSHPAPDIIRHEIECYGKVFRADYKEVPNQKKLDFNGSVVLDKREENPYLHRYLMRLLKEGSDND